MQSDLQNPSATAVTKSNDTESSNLFEKLKSQINETVDSASGLTPDQIALFLKFASQKLSEIKPKGGKKEEHKHDHNHEHKHSHETKASSEQDDDDPNSVVLGHLIQELRQAVPVNGEAPSEKITIPKFSADFEGFTSGNTVSVDNFLYPEEDDIDDLVDQGLMSRNYCVSCGSKKVEPLNFISHSASLKQLKYIFSPKVLGNLEGKVVVDIGSRLGAVLYVGYFYSKAAQLVGVEKNKWFCDLENTFVKKYQMEDRVKVVCDDMQNQVNLLANADVVIMNNVFEFFVKDKKQLTNLWKFVKRTIVKKGCKIVTIPSIESSIESAGLSLNTTNWVKPINIERPQVEDEVEMEDYEMIYLYEVM